MKTLFVPFAAALLAAPSVPDPTPQWSDATPPTRFWRVGLVPVVMVPPDAIDEACGPVGQVPEGMHVVACTRRMEVNGEEIAVVVMPHPCVYAHADPYAQVLCHEHAHYLAGWQHEAE